MAPVFGCRACLEDRPKSVWHEQLIADTRVEGLDEGVLCGLTRLGEQDLDAMLGRQRFERRGDELGAVINAQGFRICVFAYCLINRPDNRRARIRECWVDGQRIAAALVEERQ